MIHVGVAELKARLSEYLARVQEGEEIVVADRGRPVARLIPAGRLDEDAEALRLRDLQRRGVVRLGSGTIPREFWEIERPDDRTGSVLKALEDERSNGR